MARRTKEQKRIDDLVDVTCQNASYGCSIPIMELGTLHNIVRAAAVAGQDVEAAAKAAFAKYRIDNTDLLIPSTSGN